MRSISRPDAAGPIRGRAVMRCGWLLLLALTACASADRRETEAFRFALVGDYNYGPIGGTEWQASERMIAAINAEPVRFSVHLGDIQSGKTECLDAVVEATRAQFSRFAAPLVYLFGDNEWTDCHRHPGRHADPLERLGHLRGTFYAEARSQGRSAMPLERQADAAGEERFRGFVEQVRWWSGGVLFVGANVPGSNNHYSGGPDSFQEEPGQDAEWRQRTAAVIEWLRDSFRLAATRKARAVFVLWQANPDFEQCQPDRPHYDSNGYAELLQVLREQVRAFPGPVVLAHGDSHQGFRVDRPWPLANFLRVENYGYPNTHWTRVSVLPDRRDLSMFRFESRQVPGNPLTPVAGPCR